MNTRSAFSKYLRSLSVSQRHLLLALKPWYKNLIRDKMRWLRSYCEMIVTPHHYLAAGYILLNVKLIRLSLSWYSLGTRCCQCFCNDPSIINKLPWVKLTTVLPVYRKGSSSSEKLLYIMRKTKMSDRPGHLSSSSMIINVYLRVQGGGSDTFSYVGLIL